MVYIKTHVFSLILYYNCKDFNPKWVFHYVIIQIILFGVELFRSLVLNEKTAIKTKLTNFSTAASAAAVHIRHKVLILF